MVNRTGCDVICAGMYRACSTWQYEVAAHLVEEHGGGLRLGYLLSGQYTALLAGAAGSVVADSAKRRGFRVIKAHEGERAMARELKAGRACALYAFRDVRDVVFSLMHKRGKTFEELLRQGMIHQILANDRFWMGQPNVLVQRYDDLIREPARRDGASLVSRITAGCWRSRASRGAIFARVESGADGGARSSGSNRPESIWRAAATFRFAIRRRYCTGITCEAKVRRHGAPWRRRVRVQSCTGFAGGGSSRMDIRLTGDRQSSGISR